MLDSNLITISFNVCVVKLFAIVTSNLLYLDFKLILSSLSKLLEAIGHFGFVMKKESPSVS
jgi:hypothetical protein